MNNSAVKVEGLFSGYNDNIILKDINVEIPKGVCCAIIGPNGAGKTTFMRTILDLQEKISGKISFFNNANFEKKNIAYVPQRKTVDWTFPITVYEVVLMGAYDISKYWFSNVPEYAHENAKIAIEKMNLYEFKDRHVNDLSGGQQQRVFVARALAQNSSLCLMDEPLTGLDITSEKLIAKSFEEITKKEGTVIAVHHDLKMLKSYFNWIIMLNRGIIYAGSIDINNLDELIEKTFI